MYSTPYAALAARAATVSYANSARPDAPVVPGRPHRSLPKPTIVPARTAAAGLLRRLADAVAPRPAANCGPSGLVDAVPAR